MRHFELLDGGWAVNLLFLQREFSNGYFEIFTLLF